MAIQHY